MKVFTYLIQSLKDGKYYTGISNNIQKRLNEHNRGAVKITSCRRPWKLVYIKEYTSYIDARKHEKWLKKKNKKYKTQVAG